VRRWDETGFWLNESAARILVGMRLDDLVRMARTSIQIYKRFNPGIKDYLRKESEIPNAERWSLKEISSIGCLIVSQHTNSMRTASTFLALQPGSGTIHFVAWG
jgi:hypothetical protein